MKKMDGHLLVPGALVMAEMNARLVQRLHRGQLLDVEVVVVLQDRLGLLLLMPMRIAMLGSSGRRTVARCDHTARGEASGQHSGAHCLNSNQIKTPNTCAATTTTMDD